jgi:hypothetical protein
MTEGRREPYIETFDNGPGGWCGWRRQSENMLLPITDGVMAARGPWGVDAYHAPNYLTLITYLHTRAGLGLPIGRPNRFVDGGFSRDLTNATITARLRGQMHMRGAQLTILAQADVADTRANFILIGQHFDITDDWTEQSVTLVPDRNQWQCVGVRHDIDHYGFGDIVEALTDVNVDLIFVLYPVTVVPLEPTDDIHRLRPGSDYPIDERHLPHGEIQFDTIRIDYPA